MGVPIRLQIQNLNEYWMKKYSFQTFLWLQLLVLFRFEMKLKCMDFWAGRMSRFFLFLSLSLPLFLCFFLIFLRFICLSYGTQLMGEVS